MNGKCRVSVVFLSSCCFPCQNLLTLLVLSSHCPHFQTYINMMNDRIRRQYAYENPFHFKWIRSLGQAGGPFCIGLLVGVPSSSSPLSPSDAVWSTLPFRPIPGQTGSVCPVMAVHCACTAKRSPCLCHLLTLQSRTHRCPPSGRGGGNSRGLGRGLSGTHWTTSRTRARPWCWRRRGCCSRGPAGTSSSGGAPTRSRAASSPATAWRAPWRSRSAPSR